MRPVFEDIKWKDGWLCSPEKDDMTERAEIRGLSSSVGSLVNIRKF